MSPFNRSVTLGAGTAVGSVVLFAPAAQAATFTVTNLNDSGAGSLRQAVLDANAAGGDDIVTFQSSLSGTIALTSDDIPITTDGLEIQGPGANVITVDPNNTSRVFYIQSFTAPNEAVKISGLTLTRGRPSGVHGDLGGALYSDTGNTGNAADVTLTETVITNSSADGRGGAIWIDYGSLTVLNSTITNNVSEAGEGGGAIYLDDTDPVASGPGLVIRNSTLSGNQAIAPSVGNDGNGGAIASGASDADIVIEDSTFSGNTSANRYGGAIWTDLHIAKTRIDDSTFSGNNAEWGGAIYLYRGTDDVTISNTTITGNTGDSGAGALWTDPNATGVTTIRNSTITGNTAPYTGGVFFDDDNGSPNNPFVISSSIIAGNTQTDPTSLYGADLGQQPTAAGFDIGFSILGSTTTANITEDPAGSNQTGVDPQLGPLAANGGPTQTHLPALSSPAVDAGIANSLGSEQRGFLRTVDTPTTNRTGSDGTDVGAVEVKVAGCKGQTIFADFPATEGNDTLTGTTGADSIAALGGNDTVTGLAGDDCVTGDANNDTVKGGPDDDQVRGGNGTDKGRGQGGADSVKGQDGKDNVAGGGGKDKVSGGDGNDTVKGGGGKDKLKGDAGKDTLNARDGEKDKVNCGGGKDTAKVDDKDKVSKNCETVS